MKKIILLFTFLLFANKAAAITYETLNINMPVKVKINKECYISSMENWNNIIMDEYNKYISNKNK